MNELKLLAARAAIAEVDALGGGAHVIGLGSGSTATLFIEELAKRVRDGAKLTSVATSNASRALAEKLGIPLLDDAGPWAIDLNVDNKPFWVAMQELWASQRWIHSTVVADAEQFAQITLGVDWQVERPVERVEPAVIRDPDATQIAVLIHCPIERQLVMFHRIRVPADQSIEFAESILVAHGPRGYLT